ncbi:MAG: hypothetical protein PHY46_04490, partial [Candidatus Omnitrophica bacterium]|nr:hypothetical protein [Candidatus Omnitrophota bacterium]
EEFITSSRLHLENYIQNMKSFLSQGKLSFDEPVFFIWVLRNSEDKVIAYCFCVVIANDFVASAYIQEIAVNQDCRIKKIAPALLGYALRQIEGLMDRLDCEGAGILALVEPGAKNELYSRRLLEKFGFQQGRVEGLKVKGGIEQYTLGLAKQEDALLPIVVGKGQENLISAVTELIADGEYEKAADILGVETGELLQSLDAYMQLLGQVSSSPLILSVRSGLSLSEAEALLERASSPVTNKNTFEFIRDKSFLRSGVSIFKLNPNKDVMHRVAEYKFLDSLLGSIFPDRYDYYLSESNNLAELRKRNAFDFDNIYCLNLGDEALEQYIKGVAARHYEISSSRQGGIAEINYFRLSLRLDEVISCDRQQALQEGDKILSSTYTQGSAICLYANIYTQWHSGIDNIIVEPINEDLRRVTIQTHYRGRYSSSPVVLVPDLAKIIAKRDISGFNRSLRCAFPHQSTAPRDEDILAKLGIEKNDVVFGFAGYFGDWLGDLGRQGAKVVYTDISPKIVKWVKRRNKGLFTEIRVGDPLKEPCQVNLYDWSFSYEPLPLEPNEWPIAMLRSLLNRKGLIMVASWGDTRGTKEQLRGFADIYGLKGRVDIEQGERLKVAGHAGEVHKGWVIIDARKRLMRIDFVSQQHCLAVIITTNEDLRAKAMQDILMIEALQSFKGRPLFELQSYLAEGNNAIDQQALLGSIERVTKLAMLIPEEFQIKIELDSSISSPVENAEIKSQPYRVVFSEQAEKDKEDLNEPLKIRLQNKVDLIKHNPRIGKSLHLYGYGCQFERFEKSAVIYYVDEPNQVIHMLRICRESEIKGKSVIKSIMKQLGDIRPKTTEGAKSSLASKLFNYGVISFEAQRIINTILSIKGVRLATQRNRIFFIFPSSIEKIKEQLNKTQSLRLKPDLERVGKFDLLDLGNDGREPAMIAKVGREDSGIALGLSNPNNPQALIIIRKLIRNVVVLTAGLLVLGGWFLNIPAAVGFAAATALAMGLAWQDEVAENGNGCSGAIPDILRSEGVLGIIKEELLSRVFLKYEDSKQDKKTYCNIRELSKKYGWKEHSRDKSAIIAKIKELLREKEEEIGFIIKDSFIKSPVELEKIESCIKKYVLAKMGVDREKDKEYQAWLMVYAFLILRGRRHNKEGIHSLKSESKMRRKRMKVENIAEVDDRLSSELKDIFSLDFIILLNGWIEEAKSNAKQKAAEKMSKVLVNRPIGAKRGFFAGEYYGDDDDDRVVQRYEASEQKRTEKTPSPAKFTLSSLYGFEIGDTVRHKALGIGRVVRLDGGMMFVWFKTVGEKQFQLSTAKQFFEILEGDDKESAATFASQPKNKIKRNLSVKRIEP